MRHLLGMPKRFSITLTLCFNFIVASLFSLPIDLSDENSQLVFSIDLKNEQDNHLDLYNFSKNTIYVLQIQGKIQLLNGSNNLSVELGKNNSVLIENEEQLSEDDIVVLNMVPLPDSNDSNTTVIQIDKILVKTDEFPNLGNEMWGQFIDKGREWTKPGAVTEQLFEITKENKIQSIFTIGCGSGKDSLYWADQGTQVTILDGTPHAVAVTSLRFAEKNSLTQLNKALACSLQSIPEDLGSFEAVTGTSVFSFIPPDQFEEVMSAKVFSHVAYSGYFSGNFFGPEHAWSENKHMTFVNADNLIDLFTKYGFEIVWINEIKKEIPTVFDGIIYWHEIQVVAQKLPPTSN
jgi:hypothetical protein